MERNKVESLELRDNQTKLKAQHNQSATNFKDFSPQRNFHNVSKLKIKAQHNFCNCGDCGSSASNCAWPISANYELDET